jgi:hypothetical protein
VESLAVDHQEIEPEGKGHIENDPAPTREQLDDPLGLSGPSYETGQAERARDANPGGSTDPNDSLDDARGTTIE